MPEKGNIKTIKAVKSKPASPALSDLDNQWVAAMAKDIAVHSSTGSFLLLFADGKEMDVYVSTEP